MTVAGLVGEAISFLVIGVYWAVFFAVFGLAYSSLCQVFSTKDEFTRFIMRRPRTVGQVVGALFSCQVNAIMLEEERRSAQRLIADAYNQGFEDGFEDCARK